MRLPTIPTIPTVIQNVDTPQFLIDDDYSTDTLANYTAHGGTWAVAGGEMKATVSGGNDWNQTILTHTAVTVTDFDLTCRVKKPAGNVQVVFRTTGNADNGYGAQIRDTNTFRIERYGQANLVSANPQLWVTGDWYQVRIQCIGSALKAKIWEDGEVEPETWTLETTNTVYASGKVGFSTENGTTSFDDLQVTDLS